MTKAIKAKTTNKEERAKHGETTNDTERAMNMETTTEWERANAHETTIESERDEFDEAPRMPERWQRDLPFWCDTALNVEKLRVACQVRASHLKRNNADTGETDKLLERLQGLEGFIDGELARWVVRHPAFPWFSKVKGIGKENIGKVVGMVDIERAPTISALWKFAGYAVEDNKAPKRKKGELNSYNAKLRTMCWRVGTSLMKAGGCFYDYYIAEKQKIVDRYESDGWLIKAGIKDDFDKKRISAGHVHNMALRKMIKLFLACLYKTWREAEGLPTRPPYPIEKLGHSHEIEPWKMVDR